jgi:hypothetical protein
MVKLATPAPLDEVTVFACVVPLKNRNAEASATSADGLKLKGFMIILR